MVNQMKTSTIKKLMNNVNSDGVELDDTFSDAQQVVSGGMPGVRGGVGSIFGVISSTAPNRKGREPSKLRNGNGFPHNMLRRKR